VADLGVGAGKISRIYSVWTRQSSLEICQQLALLNDSRVVFTKAKLAAAPDSGKVGSLLELAHRLSRQRLVHLRVPGHSQGAESLVSERTVCSLKEPPRPPVPGFGGA